MVVLGLLLLLMLLLRLLLQLVLHTAVLLHMLHKRLGAMGMLPGPRDIEGCPTPGILRKWICLEHDQQRHRIATAHLGR